jgi:hypothetical protein
MYFDGNIRKLGTVDVAALKASVLEIPERAWQADWRRTANANFQHSHSIWTVSMPFTKDDTFHIFDSLETAQCRSFQQDCKVFHDALGKMLDGVVARACIIRLEPGNFVERHIDGAHPIFRHCYRLIIPIITNSRATLNYDDCEYVLDQGVIYDTNPYLPHSTHNGGDTIRYQAVIDLFPYSVPESVIKLKFYNWNPVLYKSLAPGRTPEQRNKELTQWEKRLETESVIREKLDKTVLNGDV